jgi:hypothetical protein
MPAKKTPAPKTTATKKAAAKKPAAAKKLTREEARRALGQVISKNTAAARASKAAPVAVPVQPKKAGWLRDQMLAKALGDGAKRARRAGLRYYLDGAEIDLGEFLAANSPDGLSLQEREQIADLRKAGDSVMLGGGAHPLRVLALAKPGEQPAPAEPVDPPEPGPVVEPDEQQRATVEPEDEVQVAPVDPIEQPAGEVDHAAIDAAAKKGAERIAARRAAAKPDRQPTASRRPTILGIAAAPLLRWMGANGWSYDEAREALAAGGLTVGHFYVRNVVFEGRNAEKIAAKTGRPVEIATVDATAAAALNVLRADALVKLGRHETRAAALAALEGTVAEASAATA